MKKCLQKGNYTLCFDLVNKNTDQKITYIKNGNEVTYMYIYPAKINELGVVVEYRFKKTSSIQQTDQEKQDLKELINEWANFDVDDEISKIVTSERNAHYDMIIYMLYFLLFIGAIFIFSY